VLVLGNEQACATQSQQRTRYAQRSAESDFYRRKRRSHRCVHWQKISCRFGGSQLGHLVGPEGKGHLLGENKRVPRCRFRVSSVCFVGLAYCPRDAAAAWSVNKGGKNFSGGRLYLATFRYPEWYLRTRSVPNGAKPKCRRTRARSTTGRAWVDRDARCPVS